jgi:ADP-heptose:LPS heptosyltransferase
MTRSPAKPRPVPVRRYRYSKWRWRALVTALDALGALVMVFWRCFCPLRRPLDPRRILVVQLDHMGDAVLSSPLFPRLKAAFPGAAIDVLASPSNREVFEADPHVSRVRLATRNWFERRPGGWALGSAVWSLGRSLRGEGYDLGIDVRGDVLTVLVLALAGIPRRLGWAMGGGGFLLTDVAPWVPGRHEVNARLALLETLAIPVERPARVVVHVSDLDRVRVGRLLRAAWPDREGRARPQPASRSRAAAPRWSAAKAPPPAAGNRLTPETWPAGSWLATSAPFLAVHLGAGTRAKRWPGRNWANLVARFLADGWRVAVIGGPEDLDACRHLDPHPNLVDWTGQLSLTETAALLERADLFLGADSGPAHLAACAGIPSVVLFSGTNLARQWRPWSRRSLVLKHRVPCRPCHQKVCPLENHPCMTSLHPDRVYRAAQRWWRRTQQATAP